MRKKLIYYLLSLPLLPIINKFSHFGCRLRHTYVFNFWRQMFPAASCVICKSIRCFYLLKFDLSSKKQFLLCPESGHQTKSKKKILNASVDPYFYWKWSINLFHEFRQLNQLKLCNVHWTQNTIIWKIHIGFLLLLLFLSHSLHFVPEHERLINRSQSQCSMFSREKKIAHVRRCLNVWESSISWRHHHQQ